MKPPNIKIHKEVGNITFDSTNFIKVVNLNPKTFFQTFIIEKYFYFILFYCYNVICFIKSLKFSLMYCRRHICTNKIWTYDSIVAYTKSEKRSVKAFWFIKDVLGTLFVALLLSGWWDDEIYITALCNNKIIFIHSVQYQ